MIGYLVRRVGSVPIIRHPSALQRIKAPISVNYSNNQQSRKDDADKSASSATDPQQAKAQPSKYSKAEVRQTVKRYAFLRFMNYMGNYDKILEKRFPAAMKVYRVFMDGAKDFYGDMKKFLKITRIANNSAVGLRSLTRMELELYYKMPKDMMQVGPVLLVSALPFANYVIFPLAYMYPRYFLTSHFWTLQQRAQFQEDILRTRISYNRKVFRCMQSKLDKLSALDYQRMGHILGLLGSGLHPSTQEIIECKSIFESPPYNLDSLTASHVKALCRLHDIGTGPLKRVRLSERSHIFHHMDLAIKREGGVHNMPTEALKTACFLRGLNPTNLSNEAMIDWLRQWVFVSIKVDASNVSLFLHLPILIAYNHPNNWKLTHKVVK